MALITEAGHYIKVDKDGNFEMYINKEAREKIKASTSSDIILEKYREIYSSLINSDEAAEFRYYDPEGYYALFHAWEAEYFQYAAHVEHGTYDEAASYPLMAEYYPDVADSIPKLFYKGAIGSTFSTAAESYENAKRYKTWGETIDA